MRKLLAMMAPAVIALACACNNPPAPASITSVQEEHHMHGGLHAGPDYADSVNRGLIGVDTMKGSPHRVTMLTIRTTHVHIEYGSPGLKGRIIWGGLVPYDYVWVTGAHGATSVRFSRDIRIDGKRVKRGTYGFFTVPGKDTWEVILNTRFDQHLTDEYNPAEDVIRMRVKPQPHRRTERLTYTVEARDEHEAAILMDWEQLRIVVPFQVD